MNNEVYLERRSEILNWSDFTASLSAARLRIRTQWINEAADMDITHELDETVPTSATTLVIVMGKMSHLTRGIQRDTFKSFMFCSRGISKRIQEA